MNPLPDTPAKLLAECQRIKDELAEKRRQGKAFLPPTPGKVYSRREHERMSARLGAQWCMFPDLESQWEAMQMMSRGDVPRFPGQPMSIVEAFAGLDTVIQWCCHRPPMPQGATEPKPRMMLKGWHEITTALDKKYRDIRDIKRLNEKFEGPIVSNGKGTRPMVYRDDLLKWWNELAIRQHELATRRKGARLSAETQFNYGRDGTAAPEIGGGVKKCRKDKRT